MKKRKNRKHPRRKNQRRQRKAPVAHSVMEWPIPPRDYRARHIEALKSKRTELNPEQLWELGRLLVYEGCVDEDDKRIDDGVEALMAAANAQEPYPEAVLDLSWVMAFRGLASMALPYAKRATELMPDRRDAWAFYARASADRGRLDDAKTALQRACEQPDATDEDRAMLVRLEAGKEPQTAGSVVSFFTRDLAELHRSVVGDEEALKYQLFVVSQLLRHNTENVALNYVCALTRYKLGHFDRARPLAAKVLALEPEHADALTLVALMEQKSGRPAEAQAWYERAVAANADHVLANTNLAKHLHDRREYAQARPLLERALEVNPNDPVANHLFGNSVAAIEKDFEVEARFHRRALDLDSSRPEFHLSLCMSYLQAGNFRALERAWKRGKRKIALIEDDAPFAKLIPILLDPPDDPSLWDLILTGNDGLGGQAFSRAVERMLSGVPRHVPRSEQSSAYADVGMLAAQCGLHKLSLRAFLAAERLDGEGSAASLNVAVAMNWLGNTADAVKRAEKVDPSESRAQTILGNLLQDARDDERALECYRRGVQVDRGFLLPIANGVRSGIRLRRWDVVEELLEGLDAVEGEELECALVVARVEAARGRPWKVIELLQPFLDARQAESGESTIADILSADLSEADVEKLLEDPAVRDALDKDLTVFSSVEVWKEAWFLTAECLWACHDAARSLMTLALGREDSEVTPDGDWLVLQAECLRQLGESEAAARILDSMEPQPPPLVSLAVMDLARGDIDQVEARATQARGLEVAGRSYNHPMGAPRALEGALLAFAALERDDHDGAVNRGLMAHEADPGSAFAALSYAHALDTVGRTEDAVEVVLRVLKEQPGEPELVRWAVEAFVDQVQLENADAVLTEQRSALTSRSSDALASQLGEMIAREKLASAAGSGETTGPSGQEADWPWLDDLQPAARRWLQAAVLNTDRVQWLKVGLATYLCKVAEMELVHRLIQPFAREVERERLDYDRRLRDLSDFVVDGGRPPSLGGILQALRLGAERGRHGDSGLLQRWRTFVRGRPWSGANELRSRAFLGRLDRLKHARNRVAHLGDLSDQEFADLYDFMVSEDRPGPFFTALGLSDAL